jgi:hypothetical protein
MFVENFKMNTNEGVAKFLAFNVESSIHAMHNAERDLKAYRNKAQSLTFNLKKNEVQFPRYTAPTRGLCQGCDSERSIYHCCSGYVWT